MLGFPPNPLPVNIDHLRVSLSESSQINNSIDANINRLSRRQRRVIYGPLRGQPEGRVVDICYPVTPSAGSEYSSHTQGILTYLRVSVSGVIPDNKFKMWSHSIQSVESVILFQDFFSFLHAFSYIHFFHHRFFFMFKESQIYLKYSEFDIKLSL